MDAPVVHKGWLVIPESESFYASSCRIEYILGVSVQKDDDGDLCCAVDLGNGITYKTVLGWLDIIRELVAV